MFGTCSTCFTYKMSSTEYSGKAKKKKPAATKSTVFLVDVRKMIYCIEYQQRVKPLPRRINDIYVTEANDFSHQLSTCVRLLEQR